MAAEKANDEHMGCLTQASPSASSIHEYESALNELVVRQCPQHPPAKRN